MALKLIVFDCDGVILESVAIKSRVFHQLGLSLGPEAAEGLLEYHLAHGGLNRREKFAWVFEKFAGRPIGPDEMRAWCQNFQEQTRRELLTCPLVPGIQEVLDRWRGRVPMYVASGASAEDLVFTLKSRGLSPYFEAICGFPPGKADILGRILAETGIPAEEAVMVGDASTDLEAAEAHGLEFYGRGEYFKGSGRPWHDDLSRLNDHLEALYHKISNLRLI